MSEHKPVPLSSLSVQELSSLHQNLQSELSSYQQNYESLLSVQQQYLDNKSIISRLGSKEVMGQPMLVPMNSSLYVNGDIESYERVIIDVGANYFISKKLPAALDFYDRKIKILVKIMNDRKSMIGSVQEQVAKLYTSSQ
ncbi:Prefoldin [Entamoeba marina]